MGVPARSVACALAAALLLCGAVGAVNVLYDEVGWTKVDWHKYQLPYSHNWEQPPSDEAVRSPELREALALARLNSVDGPEERSAEEKPPGLWSLEDGTLVAAPDDDAVDAAAEAMTCTVCHAAVTHVWAQLVAAVDAAEPVNEDAVRDMLDEACEEAHAPAKVLTKFRIVRVEAPEAGVSLFVVRNRPAPSRAAPAAAAGEGEDGGGAGGGDGEGAGGEGKGTAKAVAKAHPGSDAEVSATQKSCRGLVDHHQAALVKPLWKATGDYFVARRNLARKLASKLRNDAAEAADDEYDDPEPDEDDEGLERSALLHIPESKLLPYEALCLDLELLCPLWASLGECTANPKYMVGTHRKLGHCRASCGRCTRDATWAQHPLAEKELAATSSSLLGVLRGSACTSGKACLAGGGATTTPGGDAALVANAGVLPGAALAKIDGFVLGKPFWGVPEVAPAPGAAAAAAAKAKAKPAAKGGTAAAPADDLEAALAAGGDGGLAGQLVSIPGMDDFFVYQLHYGTRVYQFHRDPASGQVTEEHVLGLFSPEATARAAALDAAVPPGEAGEAWAAQLRGGGAAAGAEAAADAKGAKAGDAKAKAAEAAKAAKAADAKPAAKAAEAKAAEAKAAKAADAKPAKAAEATASAKAADAKAGGAAAAAAAPGAGGVPPPFLDLLDYLPDTPSMVDAWWPFHRQLYTDGEACTGEGGGRPRQVELRLACSPAAPRGWRMLVREPEFCRYVVVLYHPALCALPRFKPVPRPGRGGGAGGAGGPKFGDKPARS
ncbi:P4H4 [Scenedesmus sp. PABB004]|nr:P4H4 [Scenedesmus sp. PABB004]